MAAKDEIHIQITPGKFLGYVRFLLEKAGLNVTEIGGGMGSADIWIKQPSDATEFDYSGPFWDIKKHIEGKDGE